MLMVIAALFIRSPTWRQIKCPSVGEQINRLWCIYTIGYYSAINMNKWLIHTTWMNATGIRLNQRRQLYKRTYCIILIYRPS